MRNAMMFQVVFLLFYYFSLANTIIKKVSK